MPAPVPAQRRLVRLPGWAIGVHAAHTRGLVVARPANEGQGNGVITRPPGTWLPAPWTARAGWRPGQGKPLCYIHKAPSGLPLSSPKGSRRCSPTALASGPGDSENCLAFMKHVMRAPAACVQHAWGYQPAIHLQAVSAMRDRIYSSTFIMALRRTYSFPQRAPVRVFRLTVRVRRAIMYSVIPCSLSG